MSERQIENQLKKAKVDVDTLIKSKAPISVTGPLKLLEQKTGRQDLKGKFINPIDESLGSEVLRQQELDKLVGGS